MSNNVDRKLTKCFHKKINMINRFSRSHEAQSNATHLNSPMYHNADSCQLIKRQSIRTHSTGNINFALDNRCNSCNINSDVNNTHKLYSTREGDHRLQTGAPIDQHYDVNSSIPNTSLHKGLWRLNNEYCHTKDNHNCCTNHCSNNVNDINPFSANMLLDRNNAKCHQLYKCVCSKENTNHVSSPCSHELFYLEPEASKQVQLSSVNINQELLNQLTKNSGSLSQSHKESSSLFNNIEDSFDDVNENFEDKIDTSDDKKPIEANLLDAISIISSKQQQREVQDNTFEPLQVSAVSKSNYGSCEKRNSISGQEQQSSRNSIARSAFYTTDNVAENPLASVRNNAMDWNDITRRYGKRPSQTDDNGDKTRGSCCCIMFLTWLTTIFPILTAFNDYNLPTDLITDLFAGFTIAVLHIPQGMAYGLLAGTDPIYGLYVSLIPVMIISFLGNSKHVSYGTFAIVSIMLSNSISNVNQIFDARLRVGNSSSSVVNNSISNVPLASVLDISSQLESMMDAIVMTDNHKASTTSAITNNQQVNYDVQQHHGATTTRGGFIAAQTGLDLDDRSNLSSVVKGYYPITSSLVDLRPEPIEILTTICLLVGIIQLSMALLKLGMLSLVFSDQLVSSFTTACALQVFTAQLDVLFDIDLPPVESGLFATCRIWYAFAESLIPRSNRCVAIMSVISLTYLIAVKSLLEPWLRRKISISTLPSEIILMVATTLVSYYFDLHENYGIHILGAIPTGLPSFKAPRTDLIEYVVSDSLTIAVISFALNLSIVQIYAKKYRQNVDANQELFSIGTANLVSSFFWCFPCAASLSRSSVQSNLGVRSPLATLFGCSILVCIICYWAPLLYYLPTSTLACIIIVALKGILCQVGDLVNNWKLSKIDSLVWIITFMSVLIAGVTYGLIVGVVTTLSTIFYRLLTPNHSILGCLPGTELYLEASSFAGSVEIPHVKIFRFNSALCYLNRTMFKSAIERSIPDIFQKNTSVFCTRMRRRGPSAIANEGASQHEKSRDEIKFLVIDCSALSYCDYAGADQLADIIEELADHKIHVYLAACPMNMVNMFEKMRKNSIVANNIYPSIHDAVNQCRILSAFRSDLD